MSNLNLSLISIISNVQMSIEYKVSKTVLITPFYSSALQLVLEHITYTIYLVVYIHWLDSNFIPMDSKKFEFRNFDYIIRFAMKNESGIEKFRSRDQRIFEENRFYEIKTLTHNHVNTISDKRNWTGSSDSTCNLVPLTAVS